MLKSELLRSASRLFCDSGNIFCVPKLPLRMAVVLIVIKVKVKYYILQCAFFVCLFCLSLSSLSHSSSLRLLNMTCRRKGLCVDVIMHPKILQITEALEATCFFVFF